jgi:hypothetical protein
MLEARGPEARPLTPAAEATDPYYEAGCHPDVVGFMWERLSKKFPDEARCLVYGTPCIIQPASGILIAAGMGTSYVPRLLLNHFPRGNARLYTASHLAGSMGTTDLRVEYGERLGIRPVRPESIEWCRATFHYFNIPPAADAIRITPASPGAEGKRRLDGRCS